MNFVNQAQFAAPAAADGVTLTAPGSAWGNSGYVTVLASTPSACVLSGVTIRPTLANGSNDFDCEIDIATGAASSEVVISTIRFTYDDLFAASTATPNNSFRLPIGIDNIANGARLSARIRVNSTTAFTCAFSLQYYRKPISGTYLTTANAIKAIPAATVGPTLTTPDTTFGNSAYVQLRTNSGAALVLLGITCSGFAATIEIDIATGGAGSEVVISTFRVNLAVQAQISWTPLPTPLDNIALNARIAARVRGNATGSLRLSLLVLEKPL